MKSKDEIIHKLDELRHLSSKAEKARAQFLEAFNKDDTKYMKEHPFDPAEAASLLAQIDILEWVIKQ